MIRKIYTSATNFYVQVTDFAKTSIDSSFSQWAHFKYAIKNLAEVNLALGKEHLFAGNLSDAVLRFNLVRKFFDKSSVEATHFAGIAYFMKGDYKPALDCISESKEMDKIGLQNFLRESLQETQLDSIPDDVYELARDLRSGYYEKEFISAKIYLPDHVSHLIFKHIGKLDKETQIFEIGADNALMAQAMHDISSKVLMGGVGCSSKMIARDRLAAQHTKASKMVKVLSQKHAKAKYDIIISMCGLDFTSDLPGSFKMIAGALKKDGIFAIVLRVDDKASAGAKFIKEKCCFKYKDSFIKDSIRQNNLALLESEIAEVTGNNYYGCYVCKVS